MKKSVSIVVALIISIVASLAFAQVPLAQRGVAIVDLLNQARTNPVGFSSQYIQPRLASSDPALATAAQEVYAQMQGLTPLSQLSTSRALTLSSRDHALDMGRSGGIGDTSTDGTQLPDRIKRYGVFTGVILEASHYGSAEPLEVVVGLLVDQDFLDRRHRQMLLNPTVKLVGVSVQPHATLGYNVVLNFAEKMEEKPGAFPDQYIPPSPLNRPELNSANDSLFLTSPEKLIVFLVNQVRARPADFASAYLDPRSSVGSERELHNKLMALEPREILQPSQALALAAQDHARDLGISSSTGKTGSDDSTAEERVRRYGDFEGVLLEDYSYSFQSALEIVLQLLKDRPNDSPLLNEEVRFIGAGIRPHNGHTFVAVVNFAQKIEDHLPGETLGIQEDRSFWLLGLGLPGQPLPNGEYAFAFPSFSVGYQHVDESTMQIFKLNIGFNDKNQIVDLVGGMGWGGRRGNWHVGASAGLGFAHLVDSDKKEIFGIHYRFGPFVNFGLADLQSLRFHISLGTSGLLWSNGKYNGLENMGGIYLDLGVAFSVL